MCGIVRVAHAVVNGTSAAAVSCKPETIDLFVPGTNLGIYAATSHDGGATWGRWWRIRDGVAALRKTVSRNETTLDVFVVGKDYAVDGDLRR